MTHTGELITSARAAIILGVSSRTVHRKAEAGDLEYVQKLPPPNGAFLFRRSYIEALRDAAAQAETAEATA